MKKLVEIDDKEGLEKLLGETVTLFCDTYFYNGKLVGVNEQDVMLENASIIYETGNFNDKTWKDIQSLNTKYWYVRISKIESYGIMK